LSVKATTFSGASESIDQPIADGGISPKHLHPDTEKASLLRQKHQSLNHHNIAWTQGKKAVPRIFRHQPCFKALLDAIERYQATVGVCCCGTWLLKTHKREGGKGKFLLGAAEPPGDLHATARIVEIGRKGIVAIREQNIAQRKPARSYPTFRSRLDKRAGPWAEYVRQLAEQR
jgi:hypothetical protein